MRLKQRGVPAAGLPAGGGDVRRLRGPAEAVQGLALGAATVGRALPALDVGRAAGAHGPRVRGCLPGGRRREPPRGDPAAVRAERGPHQPHRHDARARHRQQRRPLGPATALRPPQRRQARIRYVHYGHFRQPPFLSTQQEPISSDNYLSAFVLHA